MTLVLDAGALIALERGDRSMWTRLKAAQLAGSVPVSHGGVVGQAWRGGGAKQALLSKALAGVSVAPLDETAGRDAGKLLSRSRQNDVIDAALVLLAMDGDRIITSDPDDISVLATNSGRHVEIISV
jgi:hypothetical protein